MNKVIVIGGGAAGLTAALSAAEAEMQTGVTEASGRSRRSVRKT